MNITQIATIASLTIGSTLILGCEDQGPLERAGEEIDESIEDVRSGGETTANQIDDAIDEVRDAAEDASEELSQ